VELAVSKGAKPAPPPGEPSGTLGTSGIGPVRVGMDSEQVEALFGSPPAKEEVNFGGSSAPQIDWIWSYPDGELRLKFETTNGTLAGYHVETSTFATSSGARVGSSFAPIRERYGDQLTESPIGGPNVGTDGTWILSEGAAGTFPALLFYVRRDTIVSIDGGEPQPAGE
jgi:hypothetical protein